MPDPFPQSDSSAQTPSVDLSGLRIRTLQQSKSDLPKVESLSLAEEPQGPHPGALGKAYDEMKSWFDAHENNLSEKHIAPFRQGLDNMAADLEDAADRGYTASGVQLPPRSEG